MSEELSYRACASIEDFHKCVELQKTVWRFADEDLLPTRLFVVGEKIGGQIFGAFDPSGRLAGFCISLPGLRKGKSYLHSHMLGVLPEYQNRRVGRTLKLMQRSDALARGVSLIEWTFDPLELKNAFFNIGSLGAIVRRHVPNQYGFSSSVLQSGLPTDRLVAEWWVASDRVKAVVNSQSAIRNPQSAIRIVVPSEIGNIKNRDRQTALGIQSRLREEFQEAFRAGFAVTGFERGNPDSAYLLEKIEEPVL